MQGELVHAAGPLSNVPVLEDSEMGLSIKGTSLKRVVEMYQWVQKTHKRKSGKRSVTVRYAPKLRALGPLETLSRTDLFV